jgi:hypothetical protein
MNVYLRVLGGSLNFGTTIFGSGSAKNFRMKEFIDFSFFKNFKESMIFMKEPAKRIADSLAGSLTFFNFFDLNVSRTSK